MSDTDRRVLPDWARAAGPPSASARIRASDDDFEVIEQLGFEPSGDGEHDYLSVRKRSLNTSRVAALLAQHAKVSRRDIGFAGMKDRHAVTTQWFSVKRPAKTDIDWDGFEETGVTLLAANRHRRKLKRGAHTGNRFCLVLRDVRDPHGDLDERLELVRSAGVPNYFGEQRFGRGGRNVDLARSLFSGGRLRREQRSIALSAARSLIFNDLLSTRVSAGTWDRLLHGDVAGLDGSGSVFVIDALDRSLEVRLAALDVHPTGPLWGSGEPMSRGAVAAAERAAADAYADLKAGLEAATRASRRPLRVVVRGLGWTRENDILTLEFGLDRGAFATAVLRELVTYNR